MTRAAIVILAAAVAALWRRQLFAERVIGRTLRQRDQELANWTKRLIRELKRARG